MDEVLESERCVHVDGSIPSVARPLFFAVEMLDQFNKIVVNLLVVMTGVWFILGLLSGTLVLFVVS